MTIDEALEEMDTLIIPRDGIQDKLADAYNMAIASLEAWQSVRQEIEDILETLSDGGDDWFTAEKLNEALEIIDKHLQEVADDLCRKEAD